MSISLILSLTTLALLLATAGCGLAIALLERKRAVPPFVERVFIGLAGAGSSVLVCSVVLLHPVTGGGQTGLVLPSITATAMAAEVNPAGLPACVPLGGSAAYDRVQSRFEGFGAQGVSSHEVSVFRPSGSR